MKHLRTSDVRGAVKLAAQATAGVARIAEGVHQSVWSSMGVPGGREEGRTRGITGFVYRTVQGITKLVGDGFESALARLEPLIASAVQDHPGSYPREAVLAALNGVMGDRLAASGNPLATQMALRYEGQALAWDALPAMPEATGKVLLLVHGLCMNDLQWRVSVDDEAFDHGEALALGLGYTPVYLRYNTGLHVSRNGRALAVLLEEFIAHWPVPVEEISVVAHSMGGLVARSAFHYAEESVLQWTPLVRNMVFLGTPHHGAPLEKAGNWVDVLLGATKWSRPFARLGQLRSAGITDLRHGNLLDEDWEDADRFERKADSRRAVPLPEGVRCFTVAAATAAKRGPLVDRLVGDGLVPLRSALGRHDDPAMRLAPDGEFIAYGVNHMALLGNPEVAGQLLQWLGEPPRSP
jgi:pimeloyl-ACP methyl ester carboxylesterase